MGKSSDHTLSRRNFLRLAAISAGVAVLSGSHTVFSQEIKDPQAMMDKIPRLNPGFRIIEISNSEIELYSNKGNGEVLKHRFSGLEANLFREIVKEQKLNAIIHHLSKKHQLSEDQCRKKIHISLKEFEDARLIYFGEKMIVKILEVKSAR